MSGAMAADCAGGLTAPPCRYRMDYLKFVEHHRATNADITIGCLPVDYERASDFGLMKVNDDGEIVVRFTIRKVSLTVLVS